MSKDYSFFGWIKFVYNTNDKQVFSLCNAEGFMYLYFLRTTGLMLLTMSFFSIILMIPLFSVKSEDNDNFSILQKLTIKNAYNSEIKLYIVLIVSLAYTILSYFYVYNFRKKLDIIKNSVQSEDSLDNDISSHTLHIRGINKNLSYTEAKKILNSFFEIYFPNIIEIHVIANYDKLMELIDRKFSVESYHNKYRIKNWKNIGKREMIKSHLIYGHNMDGEIYYKILEGLVFSN